MFYWIYELPILSVVGLFALVFVGLCWLGTILCRPFVARRVQDQTRLNEVLGDFLQYFGVIYGLLLGLLAVRSSRPSRINGGRLPATGTDSGTGTLNGLGR
jgi:hypothetical protein